MTPIAPRNRGRPDRRQAARLTAALLLAAVPPASAQPAPAAEAAASCASEGGLRFVCGQQAPEDLVHLPGSDWVLVSSFTGEGLRAISVRRGTTVRLYPAAGAGDRWDRQTYGACPGPLAGADRDRFRTHGLAVRRTAPGRYFVPVVHHGSRESIEMFTVDVRGRVPIATWIGCVVAPDPLGLNSVVGLADGGFTTSNFRERGAGEASARARMQAGENSGELWEWHPRSGWAKVPGSGSMSGPNGLDLSRDGKWLYVADWGGKAFVRLSRGARSPKLDSVPLGFRLDNVRLGPDGMVYGAGQGDKVSRAVRIDPRTLKVTVLLDRPDTATFGASTIAIPVGRDIWLGSYRGDRVAIIAAPR